MKFSVTKPPGLLFYTVEPNGYAAKMAAAALVAPPTGGGWLAAVAQPVTICVGVTALIE